MISATVNAFVAKEPIYSEKTKSYLINCGTKVGYDTQKKEDIVNWFTARCYDERLFNMIKTLKKGAKIILAGEIQFGVTEKEDEKHAWLGLTIKSMQFNGEKKLDSENDAKSTSSKDAKANKSKSKQTSEPTPSQDDVESDEEDDDDLPF